MPFITTTLGDISLNPGPLNNPQLFKQEEWQTFSNRGLHLIHLNINSLLPKIDELRDIAKRIKATVIGISESKLDSTFLGPEIYIENYEILRFDRNRHGGGAACYINSRGFISRLIFCHCNIILKSQCVTTWYFLVDFQTGDVCIDCLEKWEPSMKISDLLVAFQYMLSEPSLSKPINTEAAVMLIQSPEKYHQLVPEKINLLNVEGKLLTISCNKFWQRKRKLKINQRLAKSKS